MSLILEPPKPVPRQSALPADGLFESQDKTDPFSASSVSIKNPTKTNKNPTKQKPNYKQKNPEYRNPQMTPPQKTPIKTPFFSLITVVPLFEH